MQIPLHKSSIPLEYFPPNLSMRQKAEFYSANFYNPKMCFNCSDKFSYDANLPRILVQCGHSFCTKCVSKMITSESITCPICEAVLKGVINIDYVPVNQQIFSSLRKKKSEQQMQEEAENGQGVNHEDFEFEKCSVHKRKVKHFYCLAEKEFICRLCKIEFHDNKKCRVADLLETRREE